MSREMREFALTRSIKSNTIIYSEFDSILSCIEQAKGRDPHGYHRFDRVGNVKKGANECLRYSKVSRI